MRLILSDAQKQGLQIKPPAPEPEKRVNPFQRKTPDESDAMKATKAIISSLKESQEKDREILRSIQGLLASKEIKETQESALAAPIQGLLASKIEPENKAPEQWEFELIRSKDGSLTKIVAKQIVG